MTKSQRDYSTNILIIAEKGRFVKGGAMRRSELGLKPELRPLAPLIFFLVGDEPIDHEMKYETG